MLQMKTVVWNERSIARINFHKPTSHRWPAIWMQCQKKSDVIFYGGRPRAQSSVHEKLLKPALQLPHDVPTYVTIQTFVSTI